MKRIQPKQFKNITNDLRDAINNHIKKHGMSTHAFAKKCKVHPTQLYMFLNGERGLNLPTVEKIADVISA